MKGELKEAIEFPKYSMGEIHCLSSTPQFVSSKPFAYRLGSTKRNKIMFDGIPNKRENALVSHQGV